MISFVDFIQLMFESWLLESGYFIFPTGPPPQLMNARGTGISYNISLRKVELDSHQFLTTPYSPALHKI